MSKAMGDMDRFVTTVERLVETIDVLLTNSSELTTVVATLVEAEHAVVGPHLPSSYKYRT